MNTSGRCTTLHLGPIAPRVVLIVFLTGVAMWFYRDTGAPTLPVMAFGALALASTVELLAGRHMLELCIVGDELVVTRRRAWQARSQGHRESLPLAEVTGVVIGRRTHPEPSGRDSSTLYRIGLRLRDGRTHTLVPAPFRRPEAAEASATQVGDLLGLAPEWESEAG